MNTAESFVWAIAGASAAWLLVSTVVPAALQGLVAMGRSFQPLSRPIAMVVAAVLLVGVVRSSPSSATVPPPAERVIVEGESAAMAVAIGRSFSEKATTTDTGSTHPVVKGDTLWGIARSILEQGETRPTGAEIAEAWRAIYDFNADVVGADPNLILPGQVLTIPGGVHG